MASSAQEATGNTQRSTPARHLGDSQLIQFTCSVQHNDVSVSYTLFTCLMQNDKQHRGLWPATAKHKASYGEHEFAKRIRARLETLVILGPKDS